MISAINFSARQNEETREEEEEKEEEERRVWTALAGDDRESGQPDDSVRR